MYLQGVYILTTRSTVARVYLHGFYLSFSKHKTHM